MTKRGFEFMQKWISENVDSDPTSGSGDTFLISVLQRLRDDAKKVGIGWLEMAEDPEDIKDAVLAAMKR